MKKLALFLALCLLAATLPVGALAEDYVEYVPEVVPEEAVGETGAEGLIAEPEGDAPDDPYDLSQYEQGEFVDADALYAEDMPEPAVEAPADEPVDPATQGTQVVDAVPHTDPAGPQLAANAVTLGVGETFALNAALPTGVTGAITYASTNAAIASVDASGVVTAVAPGDVTVTATVDGGAYAECFVSVMKAPDTVSFAASTFALGKGETTANVSVVIGSQPGQFAGHYTLTSSKPKIVSVEANGALRGRKTGKAVLTVTTYNGLTAKCNVQVFSAPKKVALQIDKPMMGVGETGQASYTLPRKTASQATFTSENPGVVSIDPVSGQMKALSVGIARIRVTTFNGKTSAQDVVVGAAPVTLTFPSDQFVMGVGMTVSSAAALNEGAAAGIQYTFANPGIASFEKGVLKALAAGTTTLTASTYNGLTATCTLVVKPKPAYVRLPYKKLTIGIGESVQLVPDVGDSASTFTYATSAKKRVSVTQDGVITGLAKGKANITIRTYNKKKFTLKVTVTNAPAAPVTPVSELPVSLEGMTLEIPARTTDIAGISANLARIEALRVSANKQIDAMVADGVITSADAGKRRSMVNNAFADYAFPWMTPAYQAYWKAANSEDGAKDFKPGIVYYGMPYISGSGKNRVYNVPKALSEARYTDSGAGYYVLNQKNLLNKRYCGNDCSGFVDAAIWGTKSSRSADRTTEIAKNNAYKTIADYGQLRTGDLICRSSAHVVMFLYWANTEKTQMMIIENGGIEPGTNTVHCMIMDTAFYTSKGYSVRRLTTLG